MKAFVAKPVKYKVRKKGKTYEYYRVYVPRSIIEEIGTDYVLVAVARPEWYHLVDWGKPYMERVFRGLDRRKQAELCILGLVPEEFCRGVF